MAKSQTELELISCSIVNRSCNSWSFPGPANSSPTIEVDFRFIVIIAGVAEGVSPAPSEVGLLVCGRMSLGEMSLLHVCWSIEKSLQVTGLDNSGRNKLVLLVWNKLFQMIGDKPITETHIVEIVAELSVVLQSYVPGENPQWCSDGEGVSCVICLEDLCGPERRMKLACGHLFHTRCFWDWRHHEPSGSCPLCRSKMAGDGIIRLYQN